MQLKMMIDGTKLKIEESNLDQSKSNSYWLALYFLFTVLSLIAIHLVPDILDKYLSIVVNTIGFAVGTLLYGMGFMLSNLGQQMLNSCMGKSLISC